MIYIKENDFFANENSARLSHILCREILRLKGKNRKAYFDKIPEIWDKHTRDNLPYLYYNEMYNRVSKDDHYKYMTIDFSNISRD